jgi:hypothetical protein
VIARQTQPAEPLAYNEFPIGAVLTIACGSATQIFCTYKECIRVLGFMAHQVPHPDDTQAYIDTARPAVLAQHPELADVKPPTPGAPDTVILAWLKQQEEALGATFTLEPLAVNA